ncbi:Calcineurin B-like protein 9 [Dendrobium catenatum]|uniref:Calcineurin B-like protein n=1 Tax=Dendrobium catenatum TaxID=906689 RepID=A0A2I0XJD2_9ASPA|nr:Calcineurin B-like protein 9 [Dendrobium catenatum]
MQSSSFLTVGERLCFTFLPLIAIFESLIFVVTNCFESHPKILLRSTPQARHDFAKLAEESRCFTVNEVEALHELYKKLSCSIINDGLIHKLLQQ